MSLHVHPSRLNLIFGHLFLLSFIISGIYMQQILVPEFENEYLIRMEARASHIYILFIAMMNLMSYRKIKSHHKTHRLEYFYRYLLILAGFLSILAFALEHRVALTDRNLTFVTIAICLTAIFSYLVHEGRARRKRSVY